MWSSLCFSSPSSLDTQSTVKCHFHRGDEGQSFQTGGREGPGALLLAQGQRSRFGSSPRSQGHLGGGLAQGSLPLEVLGGSQAPC